MAKETYRIPILQCVLACMASLLLGMGIGYSATLRNQGAQQAQNTFPVQNTIAQPTPVAIPSGETTIPVTLYFNNVKFNPQAQDCSAVYPVKRNLRPTNVPMQATIALLFAGPTAEEKSLGYDSVFSDKTKNLFRSAALNNGAFSVDLSRTSLDELVKAGVTTKCGMAQYTASISKTMLGITGIKSVDFKDFSIDGDKAAYLSLMKP